ncbi:heme exporter protein CcmB [Desulfosporosinus youngiae]|uniref:ABC-type transport system involved in cytochrome c biogenesis, permease component n=1 Tax=Desulfosporosinus youngiae DSM 17734 TaxID=768710 RepID=H5XVZ1_9FIRM|nr:heme exporter protein CcmB [Desulfosporosinus youngiae]EHQ90443.1 ABC-type transport system involved in cytochrome c biogenesis, permease component [Desulfosporosinus youngiae DSM 17734]
MIRQAMAIAYKDFQIESGKLRLFTSLISLSFSLIFLSSLVSAKIPESKPEMAALTMWLILIYLLFQTLNRSLATEDESGCWDAFLICPISPRAIFLGKFIYNLLLIILVELITFPFYLLFFNLPGSFVLTLVPICLAALGFVAVGLLVSLFSLGNQGRELLSNVTSLPLFLPALFLGLSITVDLYKGGGLQDVWKQILLLGIYDLVFIAISFIAFDTNHIES